MSPQSWDELMSFKGKRCTVIISYDDCQEETGTLIDLDEWGEAQVKTDDDVVHYMWPVLEIKEAANGDG